MVALIETPLIPPPGRKKGCHTRMTQYGRCRFARAEDRIEIVHENEIEELIAVGCGDWEHHVKTIFDQNGYGSCAMESTTQSAQMKTSQEGGEFVLLNPLSGYAFTSGGRDNGSNIDDNLEHLIDVGLLPEEVWPRSKGFKTKPPQSLLDSIACRFRLQEALDAASIAEVRSLLLKVGPVVFGWQGHSCLLTKILDKSWARYANSWGDWGEAGGQLPHGFGTIRFSSINFGYGAWAPTAMVEPGDWRAEVLRLGYPLYDALGNVISQAG